MTRDEILNMPAGREMDALVAEKIMGWHRELPYKGADYFVWAGDDNVIVWHEEDDYDDIEGWYPSTRMNEAWEVVEKLKLAIIPRPEGMNGWLVKWDNEKLYSSGGDEEEKNPMIGWTEMDWLTHIASAETAPLAVCYAALLSVLEKGND